MLLKILAVQLRAARSGGCAVGAGVLFGYCGASRLLRCALRLLCNAALAVQCGPTKCEQDVQFALLISVQAI